MKAMVFGAKGQVGTALRDSAPQKVAVVYMDASDCDITDAGAVSSAVTYTQPQLIINAAAYTAVDKAETDKEAAHAVNVEGTRNLAAAASEVGARLVHISTEYVFDGTATSPIKPDATPNPLSVYGETKWRGEQAALAANPGRTIVIRTSWVYSSTGSNFVKTMLRLLAERDELSVVVDQVGSPTSASSLARAIWDFAYAQDASGTFHWCDAGATTWFDFAVEIQRQGLEAGILQKKIPIRPIPTTQYPTPARRPEYGVLDCSASCELIGRAPSPWQDNLKHVITELSK